MIGDDEKKSDSAIELAFLLALDGASDAQALYSSRTMTAIAGDSSRGLEYDDASGTCSTSSNSALIKPWPPPDREL